jgi:hypothetical protein
VPAFWSSLQNEELNCLRDETQRVEGGMTRGKKTAAGKRAARRFGESARSVRRNLRQAHRILERAEQTTRLCYEKAGMAMLSAKASSGMSEEQFASWLASFGLNQDRVRRCLELGQAALGHPASIRIDLEGCRRAPEADARWCEGLRREERRETRAKAPSRQCG